MIEQWPWLYIMVYTRLEETAAKLLFLLKKKYPVARIEPTTHDLMDSSQEQDYTKDQLPICSDDRAVVVALYNAYCGLKYS